MPDEHELVRARKKFTTLRRYEKRLQDRWAMIDWEYDVLLPQVKELEQAFLEGKVPQFELTDGTR